MARGVAILAGVVFMLLQMLAYSGAQPVAAQLPLGTDAAVEVEETPGLTDAASTVPTWLPTALRGLVIFIGGFLLGAFLFPNPRVQRLMLRATLHRMGYSDASRSLEGPDSYGIHLEKVERQLEDLSKRLDALELPQSRRRLP